MTNGTIQQSLEAMSKLEWGGEYEKEMGNRPNWNRKG